MEEAGDFHIFLWHHVAPEGLESGAAAGGLDVAIALAQPGLPGEKIRKTMGKPWENHRNTIGNHRKTIGKP